MNAPKVVILCAPGTNRERDLSEAFALEGAKVVRLTMAEVEQAPKAVEDAAILALPGGFSYGDALGAGRLWGVQLRLRFRDLFLRHLARQRPILGICNGFQALMHAGIFGANGDFSLGPNVPSGFRCQWVELEVKSIATPWGQALGPIRMRCPMAHGEGRLVVRQEAQAQLESQALWVYREVLGAEAGHTNPNGSVQAIAGLCDPSGWALGLMPHPENHLYDWQAPPEWKDNQRSGRNLFQAALRLVR